MSSVAPDAGRDLRRRSAVVAHRGCIMHVTYNANNRQQAEVAIHVPEFNGVADGILAGPALAREGYADDCRMGRVGAVVLVKDSPTKKRNSERLEISVSC